MSAVLKQPARMWRPMQAEDLQEVMRIESAGYPFPWTEGIFRDCMRVGYACWVLAEGDHLLGYGIMSAAHGESHLLNLCVDPGRQGQGHGRDILRRLLLMCAGRADMVFLEVRPSNVAAVQLYLSEGFNEIGRRKGYYPAAEGREDALVLARVLLADELT